MTFQPMQAEYMKIKPVMPDLERASLELKRYKKKEAEETAWIGPAVAVLQAGLADEIKAGTAEVAGTGTAIVVNIAEQALYTPGSVTFAKESPQLRAKLAGLLAGPEVKGKQISIGHTTDPVPAQGKGRKRTPPREARALAADRSVALAKNLEQSKVDQNALVAAAYSSRMPDTGFRIKERKTVIVIGNPPAPAPVMAAEQARPVGPVTKPSVTTQPTATAAPKAIPLKPAEPKAQ
jgi:flagellar motor protein MotB